MEYVPQRKAAASRLHHHFTAETLLFTALLISSQNAFAFAEPKPEISVKDIYRVALKNIEKIESVKVSYDLSWTVQTNVPSSADLVFKPYHHIFMTDLNRVYSKVIRTKKEKSDPDVTSVYDSKDTIHVTESHSSAIVVNGREWPVDAYDCYARSLLHLDYKNIGKVGRFNGWYFPYCLQPLDPVPFSKHTVLPARETVDGASCYVLEYPGLDKIWVDPLLSFAIRKRVRFVKRADGGSQKLSEIVNSDFTEPLPGIFVPLKSVQQAFGRGTDPEEFIDIPTHQCQIQVKSISLNDVKDDDFNVHLPAGTLVLFLDHTLDFTVSEDTTTSISSLRERTHSLPPSRTD